MVLDGGYDSFSEVLAAANGDYTTITYTAENADHDVSALVEWFGADALAEMVDSYIAHMGNHAWVPDTTIAGTYGYGLSSNSSSTSSISFTDVAAGSSYYDAVVWAVNNNITTGTSETTFSPDMTVSRAQVMTFLWRAAGSPTASAGTVNPFTDVSASDWYYDAVLWAVAEGITEGTSATTFSPEEICSRAEVLTFIYRYEDEPSATGTADFTDLTADWYRAAINWAVSAGIASGTSETAFSPAADCPRSEIVTFLYNDLA